MIDFKPYKPDVIQLPFNVFDNRFQVTGKLKKLKRLKVEIHARSIFLQGLFFKDVKNLSISGNTCSSTIKYCFIFASLNVEV